MPFAQRVSTPKACSIARTQPNRAISVAVASSSREVCSGVLKLTGRTPGRTTVAFSGRGSSASGQGAGLPWGGAGEVSCRARPVQAGGCSALLL